MFKILTVFVAVMAALSARAQIGDKQDKPGEVQKSLVPAELIPPAPVLPPDEAIRSFTLQPGFRIECVASEPMVEDPVVAQFGPDGRLWVVEMRGYMPDMDGNGEDAPVGRVVILSDTDHNGKMDKKVVFQDGLVLPRALALVGDGALIGAPPHLFYCRDTNGDGVADTKVELANNFGVAVDPKRPELANPERAPNALLWARDNWIYGAAYMTRFRYEGGEWKKDLTIFRGQWGLSQDEDGRLFYDSNSDQLRYDAIPSQYLNRNPHMLRLAGNNVNAAENQLCWPGRVNPGINRGYRPEMLRDGKLKEFTAANSPYIFYSSLFPPDFQGNAFVAEPAANFVRRDVLTETNGVITGRNAYAQAEFLVSTDERFRPVHFFTGPDGGLYIVDMHHGVLQHRISVTSYLRQQSLDRGLDKPLHCGRIFRVMPNGSKPDFAASFAGKPPGQWVDELSSKDGWWPTTAQRLLVEKGDKGTVGALESLAQKGSEPNGRMRALFALEGMHALSQVLVVKSLGDADARVRVAAIQLAERFFDSEEKGEVLEALARLLNDESPEVRLQLALTFGQAREAKYDRMVVGLARSANPSHFLADAILSSLFGRELEMLEYVTGNPAWDKPGNVASRVVSGLAECVMIERNAARVEKLARLITGNKSPTMQQLMLEGMGLTSAVTMRKPVKLTSEPAAMLAMADAVKGPMAARAKKALTLLVWPNKPGVQEEPPPPPLSAEDQQRFDTGKALFRGICAACHQLHGMGMEGLAPPLADSDWVLGSEQRLVRILLKGIQGPIRVSGRSYSLDMPSMAIFDDEQIASLLTYIRREWDNTGAPVKPDTVTVIRAATAQRQEAWSAEELLKVK